MHAFFANTNRTSDLIYNIQIEIGEANTVANTMLEELGFLKKSGLMNYWQYISVYELLAA